MFTVAKFLQLIDGIYAGILATTAWEAAVAGLCREFGGDRGGLFVWDEGTHRLLSLAPVGLDGDCLRTYGAMSILPDTGPLWRARAKAAAAGSVVAEVHARSALWTDTELYEGWLLPRRMDQSLRAHMKPDPSSIAMLALARTAKAKPFGADAIDALRRLQPYLLRAVQVRQRLCGITDLAADALAALDLMDQGVVLVDAEASVVHANRAAEAAIARGDGIGTARTVLACDRADDTGILRRLVGEASRGVNGGAAGGTLAVRRRSGRRPLSVLVAPLRGGRPPPLGPPATAIVLVADPKRRSPLPRVLARTLRPDPGRGTYRDGAARPRLAGRDGRQARRQPRHGPHPAAARLRQDRHPQPGGARAADAGAPAAGPHGSANLAARHASASVGHRSPTGVAGPPGSRAGVPVRYPLQNRIHRHVVQQVGFSKRGVQRERAHPRPHHPRPGL